MKGIPLKTWEIRAILEDHKMVMRRVVKPQPEITPIPTFGGSYRVSMKENVFVKPPYRPGDILYVRETWCINNITPHDPEWNYKADYDCLVKPYCNWKWRPSIHMPREAARIFLRVKSVRAERLQNIFDEPPGPECQVVKEGCKYACDFPVMWDSTIKPADRALYGWEANPWVWIIEFERREKPEEDT